MSVIFQKEIKELFRRKKSVISIALLVLVSGVLFTINNMIIGYGRIESVLATMPLFAGAIIPFSVSGTLTKGKNDSTEDFYATLPFTRFDILLGKFFANALFFSVPTLIIALYPIILMLNGGASIGTAYPLIFVFTLFELFIIAFCMMISVLCKKAWLAILVSYLSLIVCFLLGVFAVLMPSSALAGFIFFLVLGIVLGICVYFISKSIPVTLVFTGIISLISAAVFILKNEWLEGSITRFLKFLSPFRHYDLSMFGFFDLSAIFFYLSGTVLFLLIAYLAYRKKRAGARWALINAKALRFGAFLVLGVLLINITVCSLPHRFTKLDISENRIYEVSDATKAFLNNLPEKINIYLLGADGSEERLESYIRRYAQLTKNISFYEISTSEYEKFAEKHNIESSNQYGMLIESSKRTYLVSAEDYYVCVHPELGNMTPSEYQAAVEYYSQLYQYYQSADADYSTLSQLQSIYNSLVSKTEFCFRPEEAIGTGIEYVTREYIPTLYYLSGNGENKTGANPLNINTITEIPKDAGVVLVNAPDEDYTDAEIQMLLNYSENGGCLVVISNDKNLSMQNFTRLMNCFGLSAKQGIIKDNNDNAKFSVSINSDIVNTSVSSLKIEGMNELFAKEGIDANPIFEASISDGDETLSKTVGIITYKNENPSVVWLSGADSFNISTDGLDSEEMSEYENLIYTLQSIVNGMGAFFESKNTYPAPKGYTDASIATDTGKSTLAGIVFIGIIPISMVSISFVSVYVRKKKSKNNITE